jgi:hypothetical protein
MPTFMVGVALGASTSVTGEEVDEVEGTESRRLLENVVGEAAVDGELFAGDKVGVEGEQDGGA